MKLTELLEQDKETLLRSLYGAGNAARAQELLERELDRMLFAYNDEAADGGARERAAAMIGTLRAALPLADSVGEVKVWETRSGKETKRSALTLILLIAGCAAALAAAGLMLYRSDAPLTALLPVLGGALLALFGARTVSERNGATQRKTEPATDWDKVYRTLHTAALVMDQALADAAAAEKWEQRRRDERGSDLSAAELSLMAELLEGLYGADGAYALEKLGAVRHYLRGREVETVDYDAAHAALFDCMPGAKTETLCPALVQRGRVLRRGTATVPEA